MNKNQTIQEFDENFFSSFAVPKVKDYSRLSSSPSRDQPCDTSYFEKNFLNTDTMPSDTPIKMRMPPAEADAEAIPVVTSFLSSSTSSISSEATAAQKAPAPKEPPLRIAPSDSHIIESFEKLTMFGPKSPEQRLSQRRRSEQKKKEEEKRRSQIPNRPPSVTRSRHNSVTRTVSAPIPAPSGGGVVTRSMAARAAEAKPPVRRSVMPLKVAQKTPLASKPEPTGDRSRDRTRRTNTTAMRRSVMPVVPRASSASRATTVKAPQTPRTARPLATANRSSILRMNMNKVSEAAKVEAAARPAMPRHRQPLRVNPGSPSIQAVKKPSERPAAPTTVTRARSVDRQPPQGTPKVSRTDVFNRLSTPKVSATTPARSSQHDDASIRKSAVRPVPSYVYKVVGNKGYAGDDEKRKPWIY
uniref:TPX2 domain-containing protein n=1 Tax=Caenorhabditis tropicalis TaxID=1561998 RepID=A0A1I7TF52_9PELO